MPNEIIWDNGEYTITKMPWGAYQLSKNNDIIGTTGNELTFNNRYNADPYKWINAIRKKDRTRILKIEQTIATLELEKEKLKEWWDE